MSTRSGKRLHGSFQECPAEEAQIVLRSERKSRKKQKENVVGPKKNNYVSYPADEDAGSASSEATEAHEKPKRRTRRNTLKDRNIEKPNDVDDTIENKIIIRTRRGKKTVNEDEIADDAENDENNEELVVARPVISGKKKSKKKKVHKKVSVEADEDNVEPKVILKKKGGKKKKKSSIISNNQGEEEAKAKMHNMSADSFHSATGSLDDEVCTNDNTNVSKNSVAREGDDNLNATFDKTEATDDLTKNNKNDSVETKVSVDDIQESDNHNATFNKSSDTPKILNTTIDKGIKEEESSIKDSIFDKTGDFENGTKDLNTTFDKDVTEAQNSTVDMELPKTRRSSVKNKLSVDSVKLNSTFDKSSNRRASKRKSDSKVDRDSSSNKVNTTFDTEKKEFHISENDSKKSSLISSDTTINVTYDKSNDNSRISITSDESKTENIMNLTPVLIESSVDESHIIENNKSPEKSEVPPPLTPLKREGTFTKDGSDIVAPPKPKVSTDKTPVKRKSLPSPGHTPFPFSKSTQKEKSVLNVTRSIEKSLRRSSLGDVGPKQTKVMFCSPVNSTAVVTQIKGRVIKSNLKGSNKSFVFDESVSSEIRTAGRKRSITHGEAETRAKRKRLADDLQHSVDRLSRPRTVSASAKLPDAGTPSKKTTTPSKAKPPRTKLPNFAALHQKQFARMESLDECQQRRARRARHLLTPTGSVTVVERISPKGTPSSTAPATKEPTKDVAKHTPSKPKLPTLASLNPGYTRFGFKLDINVNPFNMNSKKTEAKKAEEKPNGLSRKTTCLPLPSLAGATATRRDAAKQTVMRERSFTEKRHVERKENRTIIKGVRTNRRFELQMKLRNIDA